MGLAGSGKGPASALCRLCAMDLLRHSGLNDVECVDVFCLGVVLCPLCLTNISGQRQIADLSRVRVLAPSISRQSD